eukprot:TRINITY_DN62324_c0_g1_i1.p1 TRINITY_DN62324_c0_g1~~TRINITY_DN62324_c0_g1_i1.p1  ORF type:complete len:232 (+),score=38.71 TRINITY_DN62324_c0_g1_i1:138-833(+)
MRNFGCPWMHRGSICLVLCCAIATTHAASNSTFGAHPLEEVNSAEVFAVGDELQKKIGTVIARLRGLRRQMRSLDSTMSNLAASVSRTFLELDDADEATRLTEADKASLMKETPGFVGNMKELLVSVDSLDTLKDHVNTSVYQVDVGHIKESASQASDLERKLYFYSEDGPALTRIRNDEEFVKRYQMSVLENVARSRTAAYKDDLLRKRTLAIQNLTQAVDPSSVLQEAA